MMNHQIPVKSLHRHGYMEGEPEPEIDVAIL